MCRNWRNWYRPGTEKQNYDVLDCDVAIFSMDGRYVWCLYVTGITLEVLCLVVFCPLISGSTLNSLRITFNNGTYHCSLKKGTLNQITHSSNWSQLALLQSLLQHFAQVHQGQTRQTAYPHYPVLQSSDLPDYTLLYIPDHRFLHWKWRVAWLSIGLRKWDPHM